MVGNHFRIIDASNTTNMDELKSILSYRAYCLKSASRILFIL